MCRVMFYIGEWLVLCLATFFTTFVSHMVSPNTTYLSTIHPILFHRFFTQEMILIWKKIVWIGYLSLSISDCILVCLLLYQFINTVKPVIKTTWEIGTPWKLRTATSGPRFIHYVAMDMRNKTTSEFRTSFDSPLGVPNSQVPLYFYFQYWVGQLQWYVFYLSAQLKIHKTMAHV